MHKDNHETTMPHREDEGGQQDDSHAIALLLRRKAYSLLGLKCSPPGVAYVIQVPRGLRCRSALGWTFRGSSYCQLIREANKKQRLRWAQQYLSEAGEGFLDVLWTDECSVQLETHRRFCCRKQGERPRNKPRYTKVKLGTHVRGLLSCCVPPLPPSSSRSKHPAKGAGISMRGATGICIFKGTMDADCYIEILRQIPLPFLHNMIPVCQFMQDNDPKQIF